MQKLIRLCLWQVIIIGILTAHFPVSAEEERGIRMRGPKSSDVFPYDRYGPISSKDTLWNIATRIRPDARLTVYQVMQALYQHNPQAFVDSNINHLVEDQYLKIPSFNNMMAVNTNSAKIKSDKDRKAWEKVQPKVIKKTVVSVPVVNKKDLDTVKTEINDQLQKIDGQQQKRLEIIQNDISDSIDGLQAILRENDDLRQRLTSFNDKLGIMQNEVAKGKEIKVQMDDMIKLQQALLAKAEAREKELLLERQQAALAEQDITSSLWFKIFMGSMPAILILSLLAFLFKRRRQASDEVFFNELETKKQAPAAKKEKAVDELSLDDELNLDDELDLSLDDELNLDDELDLSLDDELNLDDELDLSLDAELSLDDELGLDDDLSTDLSDDTIHLDDDDALEDILLDDESDDAVLEGGELDQGDLDSLLAGLDDEIDNKEVESEELEGGELSQDDLNDLLGGLDDLDDEDFDVKEPLEEKNPAADVTDPDDIDALLDSVNAPVSESAPAADVTDPDDIDALLDSVNAPAADVTDPDDIDALLDSVNAPAADVTDPDDIDALLDSVNAPAADVTDPDDIDALLDSVNAPAADVTDPDDIDALLDSVNAPAADVTDPDDIDALLDSVNAPAADVTDPDDIDALLDSVNDPVSDSDPTADVTDSDDIDALLDSVNAPVSESAPAADVTDPDDIDALLDSVNDSVNAPVSESAPAADVTDPDDIDALLDSVNAPVSESAPAADVTDPDDIDALLDSVNSSASESASAADVTDPDDIDALLDSVNSSVSESAPAVDVTDPDDIDALLDSVNSSASESAPAADVTDPDDIDALLDFVNSSVSESAPAADVTDPDDIDALLDSVNSSVNESAPAADVTDPDDIDALLESMSANAPTPSQTVKQDLPDTMSEPNSDVAADEQSDIDKAAEKGSSLSEEELQIQKERAENEAKIAEFTAEYVTPFLTADFSDIMAKESKAESEAEALESNETNELGDDLDIDTLIAETSGKDEVSESIAQDEKDDVGDDLTDLSVDESFTKSELSQLLTEEPLENAAGQVEATEPEAITLSPDFNDEDILAELLAETTDSNEEQIENVDELDVIGELDDVDFDELLANIEEESSPTEQADIEFTLDDIGDDLVDESIDTKGIHNDPKTTQTEDYVSVDDLLSGSEEVSSAEPYEKTNIDVGLDQFAQNESGIDVDEDGSMSSQLDLAKMYIEMTDVENAQVVLQEVLSKGDVLQKIEAQELLDSL